MANLDLKSKNLTEFSPEAENPEEVIKKVYSKPSLLKYGEVTKLTMKTGAYFDAGTLANDFQP